MVTRFFGCAVCGYKTVTDSYEICHICMWECDPAQEKDPDSRTGANRISLRKAQENFRRFGAIDKRAVEYTSPPGPDDEKDPNWKPLDEV